MRNRGILFFGLIFIFLVSCSPRLDLTQQKNLGKQSFEAGNYETSLQHYKKIISHYKSRGEDVPGEAYLGAGKAYYKLGNTDEAVAMLDQARYSDFNDPEIFEYLALIYKQIDNLSKEMISLESYVNDFPNSPKVDKMRIWLFDTYIESENWQLAYDLWPKLPDAVKTTSDYKNDYFLVNEALEKDEKALDLAKEIIKKDEERKDVLEFLAKYYYTSANDLYEKEMKAYESNKSHAQYARLLKALDDVNANFRVALKYFKKLYSMEPKSSYAKYLANIYARFDDKERANYYRQRSN